MSILMNGAMLTVSCFSINMASWCERGVRYGQSNLLEMHVVETAQLN